MSLLGDIARAIMGEQREPDNSPIAEDRDAAQDMDQLMQSDEDWQVGIEMGTIPKTPEEGEYQNTDPTLEAQQRPDPWYRQFWPW